MVFVCKIDVCTMSLDLTFFFKIVSYNVIQLNIYINNLKKIYHLRTDFVNTKIQQY